MADVKDLDALSPAEGRSYRVSNPTHAWTGASADVIVDVIISAGRLIQIGHDFGGTTLWWRDQQFDAARGAFTTWNKLEPPAPAGP